MNFLKKIMNFLTELKNRQIRLARERISAYEETNKILSAYIAMLVGKHGSVRVSKKAISEALGSYKASAEISGDDYVITVERIVPEEPILPSVNYDVAEEENDESEFLG